MINTFYGTTTFICVKFSKTETPGILFTHAIEFAITRNPRNLRSSSPGHVMCPDMWQGSWDAS